MQEHILIFPAGMPRSLAYLRKCVQEQRRVTGSSSLGLDPARERYASWRALPFISEPDFPAALKRVLDECRITGIYTPNPVVWHYLNRELARLAPGVQLLEVSPEHAELDGYRDAWETAGLWLQHPDADLDGGQPAPGMSRLELAALLLHANAIPGMCDHEKTRALYQVSRLCPPGDVVEIGSCWGKSAYILLALARKFRLGKVLCVDPWTDEGLVQNDAAGLVDATAAQYSADEAYHVFLMNMLPHAGDDLNFIRAPSVDGQRRYRAAPEITSAAFGTTCYAGRIGLLHIDGNHRFEHASEDLRVWAGHVVSGGWIVMDDYRWPYGDGPRRAADDYLNDPASGLACAFFAGGALFMRKR